MGDLLRTKTRVRPLSLSPSGVLPGFLKGDKLQLLSVVRPTGKKLDISLQLKNAFYQTPITPTKMKRIRPAEMC
jgi:hypothetical protein